MSVKLSDLLKDIQKTVGVAPTVASPERASRHRLLATNTILRTYSGSDLGWSSLTSVAALADH